MGFALLVEALNLRYRQNRKPVKLRGRFEDDETDAAADAARREAQAAAAPRAPG